ncbi:sigma-70 family RNA polymerase sigma factor [Gemmata sp. JC717]|uniref:sigma-70 family RNA polymerase sigma factor n=1 Tax=Gemmata algarum TaxID=2975278 RepID=UPI0021BB9BCF|nr:sigma-70 family RNA polymerase sigma factor [Gemmata algarum]MDY3552175.1 sigma-70 family RNA polymerase sigma factor [Gemmata algarum]
MPRIANRLILIPRAVDTDRQLLQRFATEGTQDAFAALVRRHAGMVFRVCRRALPTAQDAEDACQATFLVLARRAAERWHESVADWLFVTARRVARDARRAAERRTRRERRVAVPEAIPALDQLSAREFLLALDEELERLPPLYREPLVLYHLEELTRDEIAARLGVPTATVKIRLERGRERLRAALTRRGVALSGAILAVATAHPAGAVYPQMCEAILTAVAGPPRTAVAALARGPIASGPVAKVGAGACAVAAVVAAALALGASVSADPPTPGVPAPKDREPGAGAAADTEARDDALPAGARLRIGTLRYRDGGGTNNATLSPDGKTVVTTSESGTTLFDLATGRRTLWIGDSGVPNGFQSNDSLVAFAPDGKTLYALHAPGAIAVAVTGSIAGFDPTSGKRLVTFKPPPAARGPNQAFDYGYTRLWFPTGSAHLVAVRQKSTVLIDPTTGKEIRSLEFAAEVASPSPNGLRLYEVSNNTITAYDADGKQVRQFEHTAPPETIGLDPAGTTLATTGGSKGHIRVWDVATGNVLNNVTVPGENKEDTTITALAITPDRKMLLAGTKRGSVHRFDIGTGKALTPIQQHTHMVTGLAFSDEGRTLVSTSWDHRIGRCDLATGQPLRDPGGYSGHLWLNRSRDGKWIAAADDSGRVELLDAATGQLVRALQSTGSAASRLAFAPDGKSVAAAHGDAKIRIWEIDTGRLSREIELAPAPKEQPVWFSGLKFAPNGRTLISSCQSLGTVAFDTTTGKRLWAEAKHGAVAFHGDGQTLAVGGWDRQLHLLDAATGKSRVSAPLPDVVDDIAVSPDGRVLATVGHQGIVYLCNPTTGAVQKEWQAHTHGHVAWGASFGPGGIWLATAGDRTVAIWDVATGTLLRRFEGHTSRAYSVDFAQDGRTVLSSSMDLTGYVWDVRPAPAPGAPRTTAQLWDDLLGEPEGAFRAVWLAAANPKAPAVFGEKLPSPRKPDPERFKKLVGQLADEDFKTRETAEAELTRFGPPALALARTARAGAESPEVRTRLDALIRSWTEAATSPESWRRRRAVVAMELAGTPAAVELLKRWAADAPGTVLSDAAAAAVTRINESKPR